MDCPCGSSRPYDGCCGPLVVDGRPARTAEELMRSRYSAYALGQPDHLFRTWHPATRPADVTPEPSIRWVGLEVTDTEGGGEDDDEGVVEYRAHWLSGTGSAAQRGVLGERSLFRRRAGRWLYVSAEPGSGPGAPTISG